MTTRVSLAEKGGTDKRRGKLESTPFTKLSFLLWEREMAIVLTSWGGCVHA